MEDQAFLEAIGRNIARIRKEKGLTQVFVAEKCGFDKSNLRRIEAGRSNPTALTLKTIAEALDISASQLLELSDSK